jgi:signal transduction histidine kinase
MVKPIIYEELDEFLLNRKKEIIKVFKENPAILNLQNFRLFNFKIEEIKEKDAKTVKQGYSDVELFVPNEGEKEPFRKLTAVFKHKGKYYKLSIVASLIDKQQVKTLIVFSTLLLQIILLLIILYFNRKMLKKVWKPFYFLLDEIKKYRIDKHILPSFVDTNIDEFKLLNNALKDLLEKNRTVFLEQKQFIDNVSHEIKTPLAVIKSQTEMLMQSESITENFGDSLNNIYENVTKINRITETLLLLSKIDNNQFLDKKTVNINTVIDKLINKYQELIRFKQLEVTVENNATIKVDMNETLSEIFLTNLFVNAIAHNVRNGFIKVETGKSKFKISNSSVEYKGNPDDFFKRFTKNSSSSVSTGLGLAIVKSICELYGFKIEYKVENKCHTIEIYFN